MNSTEEVDKAKAELKICKDCKHRSYILGGLEWESFRCLSPQNIHLIYDEQEKVVNLVTGEFVRAVVSCASARASESFCGKEGKWFEPLPPFNHHYTNSLISASPVEAKLKPMKKLDLSDLM